MAPVGRIQAYSVSLGDVSLHLINTRYPYQAENSNLCRATIVLGQLALSSVPLETAVALSNPETLLRELCFINVFSLDSMDAIVAVSTNPKTNVDQPASTISLTFGLLSVQACKDSFECFSSTIGEVQAKLTALTDADIEKMKTCTNGHAFDNSHAEPILDHGGYGAGEHYQDIDGIDTVGPLIGGDSKQFLLDGYDWTTVDHDLLPEPEMAAGEEQVALWYTTKTGSQSDGTTYPSRIIHEHFPMHTVSDPLSDGDMDAARFAGIPSVPQAKLRLLVHNLNIKLRFFDGYDWPESLSSAKRKVAVRDGSSFVIEPLPEPSTGVPSEVKKESIDDSQKRKAKLLGELLIDSGERPTFSDIPLPEDRGAMLERQALSRLLSRRFKFFQVSASGVSLRMDSFAESKNHQLVSILDLAVHDIFLAETVSRPSPVKMVGEWVNEREHPRDSKDGILMFKVSDAGYNPHFSWRHSPHNIPAFEKRWSLGTLSAV
jgi:hypothetical protein